MFEEKISPTIKEALENPNIPHIRFDSLAITPRVRLVSTEVEQDYALILFKENKAVATLEINMEGLEDIIETYKAKGLGDLN